MQRHRLLGQRRPQPLGLRASLLQRRLVRALARPARPRRQPVQGGLLGRAADRHPVHAPPVDGLALGALPAQYRDPQLVLLRR